MLTTCPDCKRPTATPAAGAGDAPRYCVQCGQRLDLRALNVREIVAEALGTLFTLELPILRTTRDLLWQPGRVAAAWIGGRRRTYINPLKFIVIIGAVVALTHQPIMRWHAARSAPGQAVHDVGLAHLSTQMFAFVCLALLLPIAAVLRGLGPVFRARRPWLDWYVLGLYTYGLATALQLALHIASLAVPPGSGPFATLLVIKGLLPLVLLTWGAYGFVERSARWRATALAIVAQLAVVASVAAVNQLVASM
ncbi:MAG: DUF3667 domain-containing protein [Planctomycetota bacterium]